MGVASGDDEEVCAELNVGKETGGAGRGLDASELRSDLEIK